MEQEMSAVSFQDLFLSVKDKRQSHKVKYPLYEILLLCLCAILCGCETFEDIEIYGQEKLDFLRKFYAYEHGIPSNVTISRIFGWLDPTTLTSILRSYISNEFKDLSKKLIPIDGKTLRGSNGGFKRGVHCLSAFIADSRLVMGHLKVDDKTNEITAIPKLLDMIDPKGATISIDAMGCQREIATKILQKEADYLLGLKGNQGKLYKDVESFSEQMFKPRIGYHIDQTQTTDMGGGNRIETRQVAISDDIVRLQQLHDWPGLKAIIRVISTREHKKTGNKSTETRYYLSSQILSAQKAAEFVRDHWKIENSLHHVLDVSFKEDRSRIRKDHAPENMAIFRRISTNIITTFKQKGSYRNNRLRLAFSDKTLFNLLS